MRLVFDTNSAIYLHTVLCTVHSVRFDRSESRDAGADLGFIKGGGLTQGTNLLGRGMLELGGSGGMPPKENFEK